MEEFRSRPPGRWPEPLGSTADSARAKGPRSATVGALFFMLAGMPLLERLMIAILGVLVVGALVVAMQLDLGRNGDMPAAGMVEQPNRPAP